MDKVFVLAVQLLYEIQCTILGMESMYGLALTEYHQLVVPIDTLEHI